MANCRHRPATIDEYGYLRSTRHAIDLQECSAVTETSEPVRDAGVVVAAPPDGVYYHGRPAWVTDGLLDALLREATERRRGAHLLRRQYHARAGARGQALAESADMLGLISQSVVDAVPRDANYLYYERPGDGIDPHVDTDNFDLNVVIMLRHTWANTRSSALVLFPDGPQQQRRFQLQPGELVLFRATSVVHARSNVAEGEQVCNLGIGYRPLGPLATASYWRP